MFDSDVKVEIGGREGNQPGLGICAGQPKTATTLLLPSEVSPQEQLTVVGADVKPEVLCLL